MSKDIGKKGVGKHMASNYKYKYGDIVGEWTLINRRTVDASVPKWLCQCSCGVLKEVFQSSLSAGTSRSCGCKYYRTADGKSNTSRLYRIWVGMLSRCNNPNRKKYPRYGGRGITVEFNNFKEFRDWSICNGYDDTLSIERINNDGNYSKENCCWIPLKDQSKNTSCIKYDLKIKELIIKKVLEDVSLGSKRRIATELNIPYDSFLHLLVKYRKEGYLNV